MYPGHTLWSGESLILECKVSSARHGPRTSAVWHRALLDPAGRRLRARNGGRGRSNGLGGGRKHKKTAAMAPRLLVRERTAELISHGEMLLLSDDRFSVEVRRYEDGVVYRLQVQMNTNNTRSAIMCVKIGFIPEYGNSPLDYRNLYLL